MKQQLATMLKLQSEMNTKVHADWRQQNFEWYRAIWIECAELLDHYGWKWWKKQTPDVDQIALELVDIWHFGLSILLLSEDSVDSISERVISLILRVSMARVTLPPIWSILQPQHWSIRILILLVLPV